MRKAILFFCLNSVLLAFSWPVLSADLVVKEYLLKASFLKNFLNFVSWSQEIEQFNVCVLGEDPFNHTLELLNTDADEQASKRKNIAVQYLTRMQGLEQCHVAYISDSESYRQSAILDYLQDYPVMTISSLPGFAKRGGHIEFVIIKQRLRFYINYSSMKAHNLKADANLLRIAQEVY